MTTGTGTPTEPIRSIRLPPDVYRVVDCHKYPIRNPGSQGRFTFGKVKMADTRDQGLGRRDRPYDADLLGRVG